MKTRLSLLCFDQSSGVHHSHLKPFHPPTPTAWHASKWACSLHLIGEQEYVHAQMDLSRAPCTSEHLLPICNPNLGEGGMGT